MLFLLKPEENKEKYYKKDALGFLNEDIMAAKLDERLKFIPQVNLKIYSLIRNFIKGIISNIMKESLL